MTHGSGWLADRRAMRPAGAGWWRHALALMAALAYLGAGSTGAWCLWSRWQSVRYEQRGIAFAGTPLPAAAGVDPWGVNTALEQYPDGEALGRSLDLLAAGGFRWVRQRFPWAEIEPAPGSYRWEQWDRIVSACRERGLGIIAVLDGAPAWARAPEDVNNPLAPPRDPADLAAFAGAFAARYGQAVACYQVWDEPNIYPHWGERDPDPAQYLQLLHAARAQILAVDPAAVVATAGLAPTTETAGRNMSELVFLRGLYDAGGRGEWDAVAVKSYGFWSGPEDRTVDPEILNFSRLVAVREEMVRHGDTAKPVWAVTWGWNALPEGWQGWPSPWGDDRAARQHQRDLDAMARARQEWPWLSLMCYAAWQPAAPADDPVWGLSLLDRQGEPGPLYEALREAAHTAQPLYPGQHTLAVTGSRVEVSFWGSRVDLLGPGRWRLVEVDGRPLSGTVAVAGGRQAVAVRGLPTGQHRLVLQVEESAPAVGVVVMRERPAWLPPWALAAACLAMLAATVGLWWLLRPYPWRRWYAGALAAWRGLAPWPALAVGAVALALLALSPWLLLSLAALAVLALLVAARPDVGLMLAVFLVPLAPLQKGFASLHFSYLELVTLVSVAAQAWRELAAVARRVRGRGGAGGLIEQLRAMLRGLNALDVGFALVVGAALLSLLASENLRLSLRELRVVVLQAAFLYWLLRQARLDRAGILRLADILVLSGTVVSLHGLYQYGWTDQVIVAEGVRRVRGIYGSPNNLALVLGRILPVMLAMWFAGPRGRRRWLYGLAALPAGLCLVLTFSKGALFLGMPAALVAIGLLTGRRARLATAAVAVAGALVLVPVLRTPRFASLISLQGTSLLRIKLWEAAWDMVRDHPLLGVGLDNFLGHYHSYIRPEAMSEPNLSHPHNWLLDFWLRMGLPGLLAFLWLEWSFFRRAVGVWQRRSDQALTALAIGLIAAMVDMLSHGLIDAAFFVVELAGLCALAAGLVRAMAGLARQGEYPGRVREAAR